MWGGWHHVEVHTDDWWITKFQMYGFVYSPHLTQTIRENAQPEKQITTNLTGAKDGRYNAQHIWLHMMVFINPEVASLPQHAHLMAEEGCYKDKTVDRSGKKVLIHRECGTGRNNQHETKLPDEFKPIRIDNPEKKREDWEAWVNSHIKGTQK